MDDRVLLGLLSQDFSGSVHALDSMPGGTGGFLIRIEAADWDVQIKKLFEHKELRLKKLKMLSAIETNDGPELIAELGSEVFEQRIAIRCKIRPHKKINSLGFLWPVAAYFERAVNRNYPQLFNSETQH